MVALLNYASIDLICVSSCLPGVNVCSVCMQVECAYWPATMILSSIIQPDLYLLSIQPRQTVCVIITRDVVSFQIQRPLIENGVLISIHYIIKNKTITRFTGQVFPLSVASVHKTPEVIQIHIRSVSKLFIYWLSFSKYSFRTIVLNISITVQENSEYQKVYRKCGYIVT